MPDGADALASELASIRRRLSNLETAPRAPHTSVRGGSTRWLSPSGGDLPSIAIGSFDEDDVAVSVTGGRTRWFAQHGDTDYVQIGVTAAQNFPALAAVESVAGVDTAAVFVGHADGAPTLRVTNPDHAGFCLFTSDGRMTSPLITAAWQRGIGVGIDTAGLSTVTSATYTTCWSSLITAQTGILWWSFATGPSDGATTSDFRIVCSEIISGSEQVLHESIGLTSLVTDQASATIPDNALNPARSPVGERILLRAQIRRTAGAGNALVAPLLPVSNWP